MKCALSNGLSEDCLCKNAITCGNIVTNSCSDAILVYPGLGGILSFGYLMLYGRDRDWRNKKPDAFQIKGQMKCIGYHITTNGALKTLTQDGFPYYNSYI